MMAGSSSRPSRITGRIPGLVPGRESVLTRSGEPVRRKMTEAPEPKDKLDATTIVVVNGPEDETFDWRQVDWRRVEDERTAVAAADLHGIAGGGPRKGPQSAEVDAAFAREHAPERAAGDGAQRRSSDGGRGRRGGAHPGGQDANWPKGCSTGAEPFKALPVRRVYIPKRGSSTKRRPLGIPVIADRVHQARGRQRAGARVGGAVRAEVLRVSARPWLP